MAKTPSRKIDNDKLIEELRTLDDVDLAILLAIGPEKLSHTKIQKIALIVSNLLNLETDAVAYNYGNFSETIMEKLQSSYYSDFIAKESGTYKLTEKGLNAYSILIERLKVKRREDVVKVLDKLRKLSDRQIIVLAYHLFPEYTTESRIKDDVEKQIQKLKMEAAKKVRVRKVDKDTVVIEINA